MTARTNKWFPDGTPGSIQKDGFISLTNMLAFLTVDMRMLGFTLLGFSHSDVIYTASTNEYNTSGVFNLIDFEDKSEAVFNLRENDEDPTMCIIPNIEIPVNNSVTFALFESNEFVDPLSWAGDPTDPTAKLPTQRWRVLFLIEKTAPNKMQCFVGPSNLIAVRSQGSTTSFVVYKNPAGSPNQPNCVNACDLAFSTSTKVFVDPVNNWNITIANNVPDPFRVFPLSYRIAVSDHGFFLSIWCELPDINAQMKFCWLLVQRPVNPSNGIPLVTGKCPLFCVFSHDGYEVYKFIVRELDILAPSKYRQAYTHLEDSNAIINREKQTVITENNQYVVTFPNGLNTDRYCYIEELDLMPYTSADVIGHYGTVDFYMYGEDGIYTDPGVTNEAARTYMAMHANRPYGTGMRVLCQVAGPGVTVERNLIEGGTPNSIIYL